MTYKDAWEAVLDFFEGDYRKAILWWALKNPYFGNISPGQMIALEKEHKVFKFIDPRSEGEG